jgi:hypothetical protein
MAGAAAARDGRRFSIQARHTAVLVADAERLSRQAYR